MPDGPHPKIARPDHDILDVIRDRWSPRAFDSDRPVSHDDLRRLFEAARWAPSSLNEQPWRFVVANRRTSPDAFAALLGSLAPRNQQWARAAPVLALVVVRTTIERNESSNAHAYYDAGQAVALLTLQATATGLSVRQMEGFDHERAREVASVPPPFEPVVVMAIGYSGDPASLSHDVHREAELKPRARRPIDDFVFDGTWEKRFGQAGR